MNVHAIKKLSCYDCVICQFMSTEIKVICILMNFSFSKRRKTFNNIIPKSFPPRQWSSYLLNSIGVLHASAFPDVHLCCVDTSRLEKTSKT